MLMTLLLTLAEEEVSNERLRFSLNIHKADIPQMLKKICKLGLLESKGDGRGTTCHIPSAKGATSSPNWTASNDNGATSDANDATSVLPKMNVKRANVRSRSGLLQRLEDRRKRRICLLPMKRHVQQRQSV
jgi:hypothetical protein